MNPSEAAKIEELAFKRMAPVISHEIRNPLATIGNSAYFIKAKLTAAGGVDPKVAKHLGIIESEVKRANDTLGEILTYTRMRDLAPKPVHLNDLVEKALGLFSAPVDVEVKFEPAPDDPSVPADADLLAKCIVHLVRNAAEAAVKGLVRVKVEASGSAAVVEVADSGPGLPPEAREKLFTPFFTTRPRGIGLGLAFVRKVVELHKGEIRVENKPGKGVVARIELPLK
jgi:two-component system sensor histidine kinase HydH